MKSSSDPIPVPESGADICRGALALQWQELESAEVLLRLCSEGNEGWLLRLFFAPLVQRVIIVDAHADMIRLPLKFFEFSGKIARKEASDSHRNVNTVKFEAIVPTKVKDVK